MVWNVRFGFYEKIARDADDALVGAATGRRRQFRLGDIGYVYADDGEIAVGEFPDVGTAAQGNGAHTASVRVRAESSRKHIAAILDYSKVTVKQIFCNASGVPTIGYYQAVSAEIIRLLRDERTRRKLSKYAVSKRSGVSQSMLSLVERGLRNPTMELTLRIADGVRADLPSLIKKARATVLRTGARQKRTL